MIGSIRAARPGVPPPARPPRRPPHRPGTIANTIRILPQRPLYSLAGNASLGTVAEVFVWVLSVTSSEAVASATPNQTAPSTPKLSAKRPPKSAPSAIEVLYPKVLIDMAASKVSGAEASMMLIWHRFAAPKETPQRIAVQIRPGFA